MARNVKPRPSDEVVGETGFRYNAPTIQAIDAHIANVRRIMLTSREDLRVRYAGDVDHLLDRRIALAMLADMARTGR